MYSIRPYTTSIHHYIESHIIASKTYIVMSKYYVIVLTVYVVVQKLYIDNMSRSDDMLRSLRSLSGVIMYANTEDTYA